MRPSKGRVPRTLKYSGMTLTPATGSGLSPPSSGFQTLNAAAASMSGLPLTQSLKSGGEVAPCSVGRSL